MKTRFLKRMRVLATSVLLFAVCLFGVACDLGLNDAFSLGLMPNQKEDQDMISYLMETLLEENKDQIIGAFEDTFKDELQRILSEQGNEILTNEAVLEEVRKNLLNDPTLRQEVQDSILKDPTFRASIADELSQDPNFINLIIGTQEFQDYVDGLVEDAVAEAIKNYNPLNPGGTNPPTEPQEPEDDA